MKDEIMESSDPYRTRIPLSGGDGENGNNSLLNVRPRLDPVVWAPHSAKPNPTKPKSTPLTEQQIQQFDRKGYIILRGLLLNEENNLLAQIEKEVDSTRNMVEKQRKPVEKIIFEPDEENSSSSILKSIFEVHKGGNVETPYEACARLACHPTIARAASQIVDSDVYIHQSRVNLQTSLKGKGFYWHSDFETWHAEDGMEKPRCLSALIPLDRSFPQNGALMVIPGSHKFYVPCAGATPQGNFQQSLRYQRYGTPSEDALKYLANLAATADDNDDTSSSGIGSSSCCPSVGIEYCELERGDVLLFDCNLMHGSHSNISPFSRRTIFYVYNSVENTLKTPFCPAAAKNCLRPEHVSTRDPKWMEPIQPCISMK